MPRRVPFRLLKEILHWTNSAGKPLVSNSCLQNARAKKPRSSSRFSKSMRKEPFRLNSRKITRKPLVGSETSRWLEQGWRILVLPAQCRVQLAGSEKSLNVVDTLVARAFEIFHLEPNTLVRGIQFLGAAADVPLGTEPWKNFSDKAKIDAIAAFVGASIGGIFDLATRHGFLYDLSDIADSVVLLGPADIEGLVVNELLRSFQRRDKSSRDVFNVNYRAPRGAVTFHENPPRCKCPCDKIVQD